MKKLLLLVIIALSTQTIKAQAIVLDANGVTIKWTGTTAPSPRWVQASPRGVLEWFAIVDNNTKSNITDYAKNVASGITYFTPTGSSSPIPFDNIVTTLVTDMYNMFKSATAFNQPIDSWDVSNVTNMISMFYQATTFNQPIGSWDVSSVTTMVTMFNNATAFNQPIGSWEVSNVIYMGFMFRSATSFNQPIGSWDVSNVTDMYSMFKSTTAFNQSIESWNVSKVTNMVGMFTNAGLSKANYDATLIGWSTIASTETVLQPNVVFDAGNSKYCNGASARSILTSSPYNWTITDGGQDCN